ncbi:MAG: tryptophan-rich sensory protein [Acetatifactor sp.]|nr:tryptophan-rich sensory protein [Acetatifactor sp.]MDE7271257.1 tryptophan-rich sensory protein [Acetatifactor sp.]
MYKKIEWKKLIISIAIPLGIGILSSLLAPNIPETYATLYKPPLAPQAWLFPVVWTILYVLMGVASYLIYQSPAGEERKIALFSYGLQLLVNLFWPVLFFRLEAYVTAFFWLALLWYLVFITFQKFTKINVVAGNLLIPYLVWLTYAGYLNLVIAIAEL